MHAALQTTKSNVHMANDKIDSFLIEFPHGHGLISRPLCLAIADRHVWHILDLGKDLARTWQRIAGCLKQLGYVLDGPAGILEAFGSFLETVWKALEAILDSLEACGGLLGGRGGALEAILGVLKSSGGLLGTVWAVVEAS